MDALKTVLPYLSKAAGNFHEIIKFKWARL